MQEAEEKSEIFKQKTVKNIEKWFLSVVSNSNNNIDFELSKATKEPPSILTHDLSSIAVTELRVLLQVLLEKYQQDRTLRPIEAFNQAIRRHNEMHREIEKGSSLQSQGSLSRSYMFENRDKSKQRHASVRIPADKVHSMIKTPPRSTSVELDLSKLSAATTSPLNTTSASSRTVSVLSSRSVDKDTIEVNLLAPENLKKWFTDKFPITTFQGDYFTLPVYSNKILMTTKFNINTDVDRPDITLVLCDKAKTYRNLLARLKEVKSKIVFVMFDSSDNESYPIITEKEVRKANSNAAYFYISYEGKLPPVFELNKILEELPYLTSQNTETSEKAGCRLM